MPQDRNEEFSDNNAPQPDVIGRTVRTDRRKADGPSPTGVERRRGPGRRLSDFMKAAEEGVLTPEQFLFLMAIEAFKRGNGVMYPSWTDVLEVVRLLGYRKTMASELRLPQAEDWTEAADAPTNVRTARQVERQQEAERMHERAARAAREAQDARDAA